MVLLPLKLNKKSKLAMKYCNSGQEELNECIGYLLVSFGEETR